jgi:hypothetical protein
MNAMELKVKGKYEGIYEICMEGVRRRVTVNVGEGTQI